MYCKNCGEKIDGDNKFCSNCGEKIELDENDENVNNDNLPNDSQNKSKWYYNKWFVILSLVIFFPLGLFLLFKSNQFGKKSKIIIFSIVGIFVLFSFISTEDTQQSSSGNTNVNKDVNSSIEEKIETYELSLKKEGKGDIEVEPTNITNIKEGSTKEIIAVPEDGWKFEKWKNMEQSSSNISIKINDDMELTAIFREKISDIKLSEIKNNNKQMTDAQFDEYKEKIIGKKVIWNGYIEEVEKNSFSDNYKVWVDNESPDVAMSVQDCYLTDIPKEKALSLAKDDYIKFKGKIDSVTKFMGISVSLDEVVIYE